MFGLVIIVILIAVIALFAVRFMISGESEGTGEIKLAIQANNMANAILKANIMDKDIKEVIGNCCSNDRDSCTLINSEIIEIVSKGLDNLEYQIIVEDCSSFTPIESSKFNSCKNVAVTSYPIKAARGFNNLKISLCKII